MARGRTGMSLSGRALLAAFFLASLFPWSAVSAQAEQSELRVRLRSNDGTPVAGALVALLDEHDRVVAEGGR